MSLEGEKSSFGLKVDMMLITLNLGIKLMCWTSSFDYNRVGVSSLTVCQCSDEEEVFCIRHAGRAGYLMCARQMASSRIRPSAMEVPEP